MSTLTPKQERFVTEYLIDLNATQAAVRAGYSERTANQQGPRLLENADVQAAIDNAKGDRSERTQVEAERVLKEIAAMAFYDPADLTIEVEREDGEEPHPSIVVDGRIIRGLRSPADILRLPEKVRRAIVGWGWDRNGNFTVKLADKSRALDQLARHLSLYNDRIDVSLTDGLADRLERSAKRKSGAVRLHAKLAPEPDALIVDAIAERLERASPAISHEPAAPAPAKPAPMPEPLREAAAPGPKPMADRKPVPEAYRPVSAWPEPKQFSGLMSPDYKPFED
ncbi:terminase small subunit [Mesorhizobium sp. M0984]|uniref:terminase small subunit n=1 Tax=Mesorhizobium sp. M0984 TaxID=2957041 RepID=UPI003336D95D